MVFGIIGYGNIGKMLCENLLKNDLINEEELIISNRNISKLQKLKKYYPKITVTDNNKNLAEDADKILISVGSNDLLGVLKEIEPYIDGKHIIHTSAGISFKDINEIYDGPVTLIIPSIVSKFTESNNMQKGVSLIVHNDKVNFLDSSKIETLFNEFSYVEILSDESDIEIATILTSCAPAYIALLIKKISEFSFKNSDLDYDDCKYYILKTLTGSAEVLLNSVSDEDNCDRLIDAVCTPNGITEQGLNFLDLESDEIINELFDILIRAHDN